MRSMIDSTDAFEAWMRKRTDVSRKLIKKKHRKMCEGPFPFLRATFYRWIEQWPRVCPRLADRDEDVLLTIGDLHVENFGVWRNSRQRLVWGVNDFDDACELPFTSDLVRLATSAMLAASDARVNVSAREVCALLIEGYRSGLKLEGQPILVASDKALVKLTKNTQEDPQTFWKKKLDPEKNPPIDDRDLPKGLEDMFGASFQSGGRLTFREQKSPGGLGSLGRRRYTAVTVPSKGVRDGREAKALVPSALYWLTGQTRMPSQTATLLQHAIRDPDPYFQVHDRWLIRQLAPHLLKLMGRETANIHLGSRSHGDLEARLNRLNRDGRWFSTATERMVACTRKDHAEWTSHFHES